MKFSEKVKNLRISAGLTQQELSKHLGISASAVGYLENGQRDPTGSTLISYAKYFNTTIDSLVGLEPDLEDGLFDATQYLQFKEKSAPTLSRDGKEMLDIFNSLAPEYQAQILEYARYFAERTQSNRKKI